MKICFVSKEVAGVRGGGIGTYIAEAGKALAANGHEAWLLTEDPGEDKRHLHRKLRGFHRVLISGFNVDADERPRLFHGGPHYAYSWLVHQTLMRLGERFDYIEFADYEAEGFVPFKEQKQLRSYGDTVLGLMMHSPTWECFAYDKQQHRADLKIREVCNLEETAIRDAPMINSPSQGLRDEVLARLGLTRDVAIIRYPMELDPALPEPPAQRSTLSDLDILYYGRIEPRKGIDELIEAFRRMPDLSIDLIGGDVPYSPYGTSLKRHLERRLPPNVRFVDAMPRPKLLQRVQRADVCIFPSLFENWPNTCIEAMSAGRVVIGSRHGGMGEMIEHGVSGFHVDGRSADDIERVFREDVAGALGRLPEIGAAAAARMRAFSEQRTYCEALEARVRSFAASDSHRSPVVEPSGKVSIVVPFYKDRDTVDAAVDSAIAQTWKDLEIVVVSDGSPLPDADEILARQSAKDPRVSVLRKENGGLSSARNYGIDHSSGAYLLFLDADNVLQPDYAETGLRALANAPDAYFVVPFCRYFGSGSRTRGVYNPMPFDPKASLLINRFGDAGAFFRRELFAELGHRYDEILIAYEDWALWMDLARAGVQGEVVPRVLYDYRVRDDSMMEQDGLPNHPALMGLLIQRHACVGSEVAADVLTTLFSTAGQSIMRVMLGHPDHVASRPQTVTPAPTAPAPLPAAVPAAVPSPVVSDPDRSRPLRYEVVDAMSNASKRIPGLNSALRRLLGVVGRRDRPAKS